MTFSTLICRTVDAPDAEGREVELDAIVDSLKLGGRTRFFVARSSVPSGEGRLRLCIGTAFAALDESSAFEVLTAESSPD